MRNVILLAIGLFIFVVVIGLFLGYVFKTASTFKPSFKEENVFNQEIRKKQREIAQETEKKRERLMEDLKFKTERLRQSQQLFRNH